MFHQIYWSADSLIGPLHVHMIAPFIHIPWPTKARDHYMQPEDFRNYYREYSSVAKYRRNERGTVALSVVTIIGVVSECIVV